jgi:serralysin
MGNFNYKFLQLIITFHVALFSASCDTSKKSDDIQKKITVCLDVNTLTIDSIKNLPGFKQQELGFGPNLVEDLNNLWDTASVIKVYFMDGTEAAHHNIIRIANTWSVYANVTFKKVYRRKHGDVRISFDWPGYWAYNKINGETVPLSEPTMSLEDLDVITDTVEVYRVTLHEFGHLLGFMHEHQSANSPIQWNINALYQYYNKPPNNWNYSTIQQQIVNKYQSSQYNNSAYDSLSIMHYYIPKQLTLNGYSSPWNNTLSEQDKILVAKTYPK